MCNVSFYQKAEQEITVNRGRILSHLGCMAGPWEELWQQAQDATMLLPQTHTPNTYGTWTSSSGSQDEPHSWSRWLLKRWQDYRPGHPTGCSGHAGRSDRSPSCPAWPCDTEWPQGRGTSWKRLAAAAGWTRHFVTTGWAVPSPPRHPTPRSHLHSSCRLYT